MACPTFRGQLWRPAQCADCHYTIDAHDAQWVEERDGGRVHYRHVVSGEVLQTRRIEGAEVDGIVARLREEAAAAARAAANLPASGLVASQVELWSQRQLSQVELWSQRDGSGAAMRIAPPPGMGAAVPLAPAAAGGSFAVADAGGDALPSMTLPQPSTVSPPPLSSSAVPAPLPASAVLPHLEPIVGDPLVLDLRGFTGVDIGTTAMDVLPFPVRQAYDESYAAPRYLVITPTTVAGVAPHPTRLGFGLLKWERSLLSLVSIVAQPLFRPLVGGSQRGAVSAAAAAVGASRLLEADAVAIDAAGSSTEEGAATVESLPYDISAPEAADTPTVAKKLLGMLSRGSPAAAAAAPRGFLMYGTALLLSFAPEVPETLALLRTVRAGLRPVQRGGWLLKRKRSERREYPLLGALAWKRRWFVLEPLLLRYYAQSSDGCAPKGTIPFSGWVEVARTGVAGAAAHAHAFVVRTGSTSHVFQAPSDEDADAWVTAIAVNAQWAGFMLDAPQSIIARSHADAEVLATALHSRRNELCANASGVGAAGVGASAAGAAVAAWVQQCGQGDGSGGGPTGADASVAPLELDLSASAIMADAARSRVREPGLSAASSAALDLGSAVGGGFASPSEEAWYYLDDASIAQGPYPSHAMRAWLSAGFLGGGTQVLCTTPLPLLEREIIASASALPGAAACESWMDTTSGAPTRFLPLVTLYEHPQAAFLPAAAWIRSAGGWPARYASAAGFDMLLEWACEAGCGDRPTMKRVCDVMASTGAPPDPGILLDVVQRVAP